MSSPDNTAPSQLTIDFAAMAENYRTLKSITSADVGAAIKANGYGTGLIPAFETLSREGCKNFFVATPDEAQKISAIANTNHTNIYVLGGLYHGAEEFYAHHNIHPVLNSLDDVARWCDQSKRLQKPLPCAIHIDTGMNRLGLSPKDIPDDFNGLNVDLIMSHFSFADEKDHEMNTRQADAFAAIAARFTTIKKSLCNSSGAFRNKDWHHNLLRPGYALYGGNPTPEEPNPVKSVVSLHSRILQTRTVKRGESCGYAMGHVFDAPTTIATIAIGYADGLPRSGSGHAKFYYKGQPCPVLGRISMDVTIVDIGHLPQKPNPTEWMEVLGKHQTIDALAHDCGTIGYEILTSFGERHHRIHKT
jgi:alanine racemase